MYKKALSIKVRLLGKNSHDVSSDLFNLGFAYHQNERYTEAMDCYLERRKIQTELKITDELEIADTLQNMGVTFEKMKEFDKAIQVNEECLKVLLSNPDKNGYKILKT